MGVPWCALRFVGVRLEIVQVPLCAVFTSLRWTFGICAVVMVFRCSGDFRFVLGDVHVIHVSSIGFMYMKL